MIYGILGYYTGTEYKNELLNGAQPCHTRPFSIQKIQEETVKTEINILANIGVLKHKTNSKWAVPTFIIH